MFYTKVDKVKNDIWVSGYDKAGNRYRTPLKFQPSIFVPSNKKTGYTGFISGVPLMEKKFKTIGDFNRFRKENKDISGFELYGQENPIIQAIEQFFPNNDSVQRNLINAAIFDIEYYGENKPLYIDVINTPFQINAVSIHFTKTGKYHLYYLRLFDNQERFNIDAIQDEIVAEIKDKLVVNDYLSEEAMIYAIINDLREHDPDILSGWNIETFDIPYLFNRAEKITDNPEVKKKFSPLGYINQRNFTNSFGQESITYNIGGISVLDYLNLYKHFSYSEQKSYKLDDICQKELEIKKVEFKDNPNTPTLDKLYENDLQKFLEYNIKDTILVKMLDDVQDWFSSVIDVAGYAGVNFEAVFSSMAVWDSLIYITYNFLIFLPPLYLSLNI